MGDLPSEGSSPAADSVRPGQQVGHYEILAEIGKGGMGVVYRARDTRLGREVALKRPSPAVSGDGRMLRRFLREARLASRLTHPHIVAILEVFDDKGTPWLAMPLVQGQALRHLIENDRPLPVRHALRYAEEMSDALHAAHSQGVLHRDINPNNVIIGSDGRALLADFGLASQFVAPGRGSSATTRSEPLTDEGQAVGTPGYTSPEQALGHEVDARSDIFSLGAVLYEMCTGRGPFRSPSATQTLDHLLHREPVPISRLNYEVPEEFERIIRRSLAKNPDERYQSAQDLQADVHAVRQRLDHEAYTREHPVPPATFVTRVRRPLILAAVLLVVAVLSVMAARRWSPVRAPVHVPTLAVATFQNLEGDRTLDYFSDGMTDELVARLAGLKGLYVGRTGGDAGPDLLVEGGVARQNDSVRIEYRLIDRKKKRLVGGDTIQGTTGDLFALLDQVAEGIVRSLHEGPRQPIHYIAPRVPTRDMGAYDFYVRGRDLVSRPRELGNIDHAIELLEAAIGRDPGFAQAYAQAGMAYFRRFELTQQSGWIEKGRTACERSAGLDQALAAAHVCLGTIRSGLGHYERAAAEFLKAIELDATSDAAYTGLGLAHQALGRPEEAEKAFEKAIALHPGYWAGHAWLGRFYFRRARYAEASRHLEQAIELAPDNPAAYSSLGGVYISMGRYEEAITALEKAIAIRPAFEAWANLGTAYYLMRRFDDAVQSFESAIASGAADCAAYVNLGRASQSVGGRAEKTLAAFRRANEVCRERLKVNPRDADAHLLLAYDHAMLDQPDVALAHLEDALAQRPAEPEYMFFAALVHSRLGHRDRAIEWLERAVVAGYSTAEIRSTAELDYLRTDVRFKTLLAKGRGPAS